MFYRKTFYNKYKNYILFNKNIIIAGTAALIVGIFFTQLFAQHNENNLLNSISTLGVEYAVYIPIFGLLFYIDNKNRYYFFYIRNNLFNFKSINSFSINADIF